MSDDLDAERFRSDGHRMIDLLADALARAASDRGLAVRPGLTPGQTGELFPGDFPDGGGEDVVALAARFVDASTRLHSARFVGHQVAVPRPGAALLTLVSALLNNGMAVHEMGPAATAMERAVVRWLAARAGWGEGDGVLTSGGSLGNLTALLAARQAQAPGEPGERLAIAASAQAHYSVSRAARILGLGDEGVVPVPTDERWRMDAGAIDRARDEAGRRGRRVFALVGSACTTASGAFDPLPALAAACRRHGWWFHVDGAHGASALLAPTERHRLAGVELADSLVWDMHKMMQLPALITAVLFRQGERSYGVFAQEATYLFGDQRPWWDVGLRTVECTKRSMALEVYGALRTAGPAALGAHVASRFALGRAFGAMVRASGDFELAVEPECNIVCFRHRPPGLGDGEALDAHQARLREAVVDAGDFYLVKTRLGGRLWLRVTLMHPATDEALLGELLGRLRLTGSCPGRSGGGPTTRA